MGVGAFRRVFVPSTIKKEEAKRELEKKHEAAASASPAFKPSLIEKKQKTEEFADRRVFIPTATKAETNPQSMLKTSGSSEFAKKAEPSNETQALKINMPTTKANDVRADFNPFVGYRKTSDVSKQRELVTNNGYQNRAHNGIDYSMPIGTQVVSPVTGVVTEIGNQGSKGRGIYVRVKDKKGNIHTMQHLSMVGVKKGQSITAGEDIARSGNSGNTTGPHMHYEITSPEGGIINPDGYFATMGEESHGFVEGVKKVIGRAKTEGSDAQAVLESELSGDMSKKSDYQKYVQLGREYYQKNKNNPLMASKNKVEYILADKGTTVTGSEYEHYNVMSLAERNNYNYLFGKYGTLVANQYLKTLDRQLNMRATVRAQKNTKEFASKHKVLGSVLNITASAAQGFAYLENVYVNAKNQITGGSEEIDPYSDFARAAHTVNATNEGITQDMGEIGKLLTNTGLSIGQMLFQTMATGGQSPAAVNILMALSAAGNKTVENAARGVSAKKNLLSASLAGGIEYVTEKIGIDNMFSLAKLPAKQAAGLLIEMSKQATIEGIEEVLAQYLGTFADNAILKDKSDFAIYQQNLINDGMSKDAAYKEALFEFFAKAPFLSFLGGAISGGLMGAGAQVVGNIKLSTVGREIIDSGKAQSAVDESIDGQYGESAQAFAEEIASDEKGEYSENDIGRLWALITTNKADVFAENAKTPEGRIKNLTELLGYKLSYTDENIDEVADGVVNPQNKTVIINKNSAKGVQAVANHEITHIIKSQAEEDFESLKGMLMQHMGTDEYAKVTESIKSTYERINAARAEKGQTPIEITQELLDEEFVAKSCESLSSERFIESVCGKDIPLARRISNAVARTAEAVRAKLGNDKSYTELYNIRKQWENGIEEAMVTGKISDSSNPGVSFSIGNISGEKKHYGKGVYLDTDKFNGINPRNWNKVLSKFVYDNLAGESIEIFDSNGKSEIINFAKSNERVKKDGANNSHRVIDKLARAKGNINSLAIVHIDELLQTSKELDEGINNSHQWLDQNGWIYKKTYLIDKKGQIYETTLNIAKAKDGRNILYALSNTKKVDDGVVFSASNEEELAHNDQLSAVRVPQNDAVVKTSNKFSFAEEPPAGYKNQADMYDAYVPDEALDEAWEYDEEYVHEQEEFDTAVRRNRQMELDYEKAISENAELRGIVERVKEELSYHHDLKIEAVKIHELARRLKKLYESSVDVKSLAAGIQRGYKLLNDEATFRDGVEQLKDAAMEMLETAGHTDRTLYDQYKALRKKLRTTPIKLTDDIKANITDFNDFRKRNMGRLLFKKDGGVEADVLYKELCTEYPELFDESINNVYDCIYELEAVRNSLNPVYEAASDDVTMGYSIAGMLLDELERAEGNITEEQEQGLIAQIRRGFETEDREKHRINASREQLLRLVRYMNRVKTTPELKAKIPQIVASIDEMGVNIIRRGYTKADGTRVMDRVDMFEVRRQIEEAQEADPNFEVSERLMSKINRVDHRQIGDMNISEVRELIDSLLGLKHEMETYKQMLGDEQKHTVASYAHKIMDEVSQAKGTKGGALDKYITMQLTPERFAARISGWAKNSMTEKLFKELSEGQRKSMSFKMEASKIFSRLAQQKENMEYMLTEFVNSDGYMITPAMRVSLYLHSKNEANLRHIKVGGLTIPNKELYQKGKIREAYSKGQQVKLTKRDIDRILANMSPFELEFAKAAEEFFNKLSKDAVNKTSLALDGYERAIVENYMPIVSDRDFVRGTIEGLMTDGRLESKGMLKERDRAATNPIVLEDIVSVVNRHIKDVGDYSGLAIPLRNFSKVYEFTRMNFDGSVKREIAQKWGEGAQRYIENLISDLQGGRPKSDGSLDKALRKIRGNYAQAVLSLNVGVAMKQISSYPTAAAVVGWEPLMKGLTVKLSAEDIERINKYTPVLWNRTQGMRIKDIGDYSNTGYDITQKYPWLFKWLQYMDVKTATKLWAAAEVYTDTNSKSLKKGTDEYYKKVAETYNRIIEETQASYTNMQLPDVLRSTNELTKSVTMFMTQGLLQGNMIYDATMRYNKAINEAKEAVHDTKAIKEATAKEREDFQNAVSAQVVSMVVFVAMHTFDAFIKRRNDAWKDDEGNITLGSIATELGWNFLEQSMSNYLGGKEAVGAIKAIFTDSTYYDVEPLNLSLVNELVQNIVYVGKALSDIREEDASIKDFIKPTIKMLNSVCKIKGIPAENAEKIMTAVFENTLSAAEMAGCNTSWFEYQMTKFKTNQKKNKSEYYTVLEKAYMRADELPDGPEREQAYKITKDIIDDMCSIGFEREDIVNNMRKYISRPMDAGRFYSTNINAKVSQEIERSKLLNSKSIASDQVRYNDKVYNLTAEQQEKYKTVKEERINRDLGYLLGTEGLYYSEMTEEQITAYQKYLIKQIKSGELTQGETKQLWKDFYNGKAASAYDIEILYPGYKTSIEMYYSDMSDEQITAYQKSLIRKLKEGELTRDEVKQTWTDFYNGKTSIEKQVQITGLYEEQTPAVKKKIAQKIQSEADEYAKGRVVEGLSAVEMPFDTAEINRKRFFPTMRK